jgi:hypothetical protein
MPKANEKHATATYMSSSYQFACRISRLNPEKQMPMPIAQNKPGILYSAQSKSIGSWEFFNVCRLADQFAMQLFGVDPKAGTVKKQKGYAYGSDVGQRGRHKTCKMPVPERNLVIGQRRRSQPNDARQFGSRKRH